PARRRNRGRKKSPAGRSPGRPCPPLRRSASRALRRLLPWACSRAPGSAPPSPSPFVCRLLSLAECRNDGFAVCLDTRLGLLHHKVEVELVDAGVDQFLDPFL